MNPCHKMTLLLNGSMHCVLPVLACLMTLPMASPSQTDDPQTLGDKLDTPEFAKILGEILAAVKVGTVPQMNPKTGAVVPPALPAAFEGVSSSQDPLSARVSELVLPAAAFCAMSKLFYRCEWETKSNKYSVAVLQDDISTRVAAALPKTWKREKGGTYTTRYTDFTDPSGDIVISVDCPILNDGAPSHLLKSYTARLTIETAGLRQLQLR